MHAILPRVINHMDAQRRDEFHWKSQSDSTPIRVQDQVDNLRLRYDPQEIDREAAAAVGPILRVLNGIDHRKHLKCSFGGHLWECDASHLLRDLLPFILNQPSQSRALGRP